MIILCVTAVCGTPALREGCAEAALYQDSLPTHSPFFLRSRYYCQNESGLNWWTHLFYHIYLLVYPCIFTPSEPSAHTSRCLFAVHLGRKVQQHQSRCSDCSRVQLEVLSQRWWAPASTSYLRARIDLSCSSSRSRLVDARTSRSCQVNARII